MIEPWEGHGPDHHRGDGSAVLLLELSPHERVIWSGQPHSIDRLVLQSAPKALMGLAFVAFTVLWMAMVIRGGNNNWDKGQVVAPFVVIPVSDIAMIQTGQWFDPNRFQAVVRYKGGKLRLINQFTDFTDFLASVKDLNPAIEIKGF